MCYGWSWRNLNIHEEPDKKEKNERLKEYQQPALQALIIKADEIGLFSEKEGNEQQKTENNANKICFFEWLM